MYITVLLLRCAASFVFSLSTSYLTLPWPAEGLQKLHFLAQRDVLLFRDVEVYHMMLLLDISEILCVYTL